MPLVCKGQCKNWCLVLRTVAFLVARLGSRQSQCRRERGWVFMGSGVWVHSGVYTFPGVFYELLEVRMIRFQELLSCMGYIHLGHYSFILNVCSWCVISRRISLMMLVLQELLTRKEDLDGWFFVITKMSSSCTLTFYCIFIVQKIIHSISFLRTRQKYYFFED